jgi:hypothetical protein
MPTHPKLKVGHFLFYIPNYLAMPHSSLVAAWLESARSCRAYVEESISSFERRELSSVYQFIRGLPLLVVDGFYNQKSAHTRSKKRKFHQRDK